MILCNNGHTNTCIASLMMHYAGDGIAKMMAFGEIMLCVFDSPYPCASGVSLRGGEAVLCCWCHALMTMREWYVTGHTMVLIHTCMLTSHRSVTVG